MIVNYTFADVVDSIELNDNATQAAIVRAVKREIGLRGCRQVVTGYGDQFAFVPVGVDAPVFVNLAWE